MSSSDEQFDVEEVDLEAEAKGGKAPPRARRYRLRIDNEYRVSTTPTISGREILALVGKLPEAFVLTQKTHGRGTTQVAADQVVDLRAPGVERFMTLARDATDGEQGRVDYALRQGDIETLNATGLRWEAIRDGGTSTNWVLIHGYGLPGGYQEQTATVALQLPDGYPDQQIDMVYFRPALARLSGKAIANVSEQAIAGQVFQRWSRHRTPQNPWRVGLDDLGTHLVLVEDWLSKELLR